MYSFCISRLILLKGQFLLQPSLHFLILILLTKNFFVSTYIHTQLVTVPTELDFVPILNQLLFLPNFFLAGLFFVHSRLDIVPYLLDQLLILLFSLLDLSLFLLGLILFLYSTSFCSFFFPYQTCLCSFSTCFCSYSTCSCSHSTCFTRFCSYYT